MQFNELKKVVQSIVQPRIMVVGDLILDKYIWGKVGRISPEAPIQILEAQKEEIRLGGAGNVMHNLKTLGANVSCVGVVGEDESGEELRHQLTQLGLDAQGIFSSSDRPTTLKTRFIAQNPQVLRVDNESKQGIPAEIQKSIADYIDQNLSKFDLVVISDYAKGVLTNEVLAHLIERARELKIPTVVDPKGKEYKRYRGATVITPNKKEIELASGMTIDSEDSLIKAAQWMLAELELEAAIITLGKDGIYLQHSQGGQHYYPARARSVYDVTGAGDTVIAALAICLGSKLDFDISVKFANCAAALVVERLGTVAVTLEEILDRAPGSKSPTTNIVSREEAARLSSELRSQGKQVVFANGCFDLLHPGHLQLLTFAKNLGSRLFVGVNGDESIRRLKGNKRPFNNQETRTSLLAALGVVDYVVVFEEDTPQSLIESLRPDILVKGEDFKDKEVVGRESVESWGGRVELAPFVQGYSTTEVAEKIARQLEK